jgi:hypothetical protein
MWLHIGWGIASVRSVGGLSNPHLHPEARGCATTHHQYFAPMHIGSELECEKFLHFVAPLPYWLISFLYSLLHCFLYSSRRSNTFLIVRGTGIHLVVFCQVSSMQHILHCHRQQLCFEIDFVGPLSDDMFLDGDRWFP